jgi:hypothetical protein
MAVQCAVAQWRTTAPPGATTESVTPPSRRPAPVAAAAARRRVRPGPGQPASLIRLSHSQAAGDSDSESPAGGVRTALQVFKLFHCLASAQGPSGSAAVPQWLAGGGPAGPGDRCCSTRRRGTAARRAGWCVSFRSSCRAAAQVPCRTSPGQGSLQFPCVKGLTLPPFVLLLRVTQEIPVVVESTSGPGGPGTPVPPFGPWPPYLPARCWSWGRCICRTSASSGSWGSSFEPRFPYGV